MIILVFTAMEFCFGLTLNEASDVFYSLNCGWESNSDRRTGKYNDVFIKRPIECSNAETYYDSDKSDDEMQNNLDHLPRRRLSTTYKFDTTKIKTVIQMILIMKL